jgi:hypothetical protein
VCAHAGVRPPRAQQLARLEFVQPPAHLVMRSGACSFTYASNSGTAGAHRTATAWWVCARPPQRRTRVLNTRSGRRRPTRPRTDGVVGDQDHGVHGGVPERSRQAHDRQGCGRLRRDAWLRHRDRPGCLLPGWGVRRAIRPQQPQGCMVMLTVQAGRITATHRPCCQQHQQGHHRCWRGRGAGRTPSSHLRVLRVRCWRPMAAGATPRHQPNMTFKRLTCKVQGSRAARQHWVWPKV